MKTALQDHYQIAVDFDQIKRGAPSHQPLGQCPLSGPYFHQMLIRLRRDFPDQSPNHAFVAKKVLAEPLAGDMKGHG
jgi:hypothetical protein